jgi:hypothetical protein
MRDRVFQEAYDRVRRRFSEDAWLAQPPGEITRAIYQEMRRLDAERNGSAGSDVDNRREGGTSS